MPPNVTGLKSRPDQVYTLFELFSITINVSKPNALAMFLMDLRQQSQTAKPSTVKIPVPPRRPAFIIASISACMKNVSRFGPTVPATVGPFGLFATVPLSAGYVPESTSTHFKRGIYHCPTPTGWLGILRGTHATLLGCCTVCIQTCQWHITASFQALTLAAPASIDCVTRLLDWLSRNRGS